MAISDTLDRTYVLQRGLRRLRRERNRFWFELLRRPRRVGAGAGDGEQLRPGDLTIVAKVG